MVTGRCSHGHSLRHGRGLGSHPEALPAQRSLVLVLASPRPQVLSPSLADRSALTGASEPFDAPSVSNFGALRPSFQVMLCLSCGASPVQRTRSERPGAPC